MAANLAIVISAQDMASKVLHGVADSADRLGVIGKVAGAALAGMAVGGAALAAGLGASIKVAGDFEQALADTASATGATADEMKALRKEALGIGKDTSKSASQAVKAMGELVRAGMKTKDVVGGAARAVVQLAEATGSDVSAMATLVSNSLNTFKHDALGAADAANIVARAANASAIGTEDIASALQAVGPVAAQAGLSMKDFATAIGIMGNNALVGSDAGTSLKTMLMRLTAPTEEAAKELKALGVNVFDAQGNTRAFRDIIGDLERATGKMTEEQKAATLATLFGSDAVRAANILIGEGTAGWDAFTTAMGKAPTIAEQSATRLNTLSGTVEQVRGSIETMAIAVGGKFTPALTNMGQAALGGLNRLIAGDWTGASKQVDVLGVAVRGLAKASLEAAGVKFDGSFLDKLPGMTETALAATAKFVTDATPVVATTIKWFKTDIPEALKETRDGMDATKTKVTDFTDTVKGLPVSVTASLGDSLVALGRWADEFAKPFSPEHGVAVSVQQFGQSLKDFAGGDFDLGLRRAHLSVATFTNGVKGIIHDGTDGIKVELGGWQAEFGNWVLGAYDRQQKNLEAAKTGTTGWIRTTTNDFKSELVGWADKFGDWAVGAGEKQKTSLDTLLTNAEAWIRGDGRTRVQDAAGTWRDSFTGWATGIWDGAGGAEGLYQSLKKNVDLITGFVDEHNIPIAFSLQGWAFVFGNWAYDIWNGANGKKGLVTILDEELVDKMTGKEGWVRQRSYEITQELIDSWVPAFVKWALPEELWDKNIKGDLDKNKQLITDWQRLVAAPALEGAGGAMGDAMAKWVADFVEQLPGNLEKIRQEIVDFGPNMVTGFFNWTDAVEKDFPGEMNKLAEKLRGLSDFFTDPMGKVIKFWADTLGKSLIEHFVKSIIDRWPGMAEAFKHLQIGGGGTGGFGGGSSIGGVPILPPSSVPGFASGGIVTRPTLAMVGEAGPEMITPLGKLGGMGGTHIHIHGPVYGFSDFSDRVAEAIEQGTRRGRFATA